LHLRLGKNALARLARRDGMMSAVWRVILPTLATFKGAYGQRLDFGAHLGGVLTRAALAMVLLLIWPKREAYPRVRTCALALVMVGCLVLAYGAYALPPRDDCF
jgi:hypothetical protein